MKKLKAFICGMYEFRSNYTVNFTRRDLQLAYNAGREFMHRITFYCFERFGG